MQNDYDEVPYPSLSYAQTHPDRLATIATLLGLQPAPVQRCRVLEIGCASGGNLFPMAYALPDSKFVGIDYAQAQIDAGRRELARLGLPNLSLRQMDILEVGADLGQFDYIIAHGIYSWVPAPVRQKLLQLCHDNLAPNGIAYISYNSYPGWHMMGIIRDAMLYRTRGAANPEERVTQGRAMLDFMADAIPADNSAFGAFLKAYMRFLQGELKGVSARGNSFLLHDELEEVNDPVYFAEFARQAGEVGLDYLAEAEFTDVFPKGFTPETLMALQSMSHDIIELEQYLDFLRSRMFRQTLLCHKELNVQRSVAVERASRLFAASRAKPVNEQPNLDEISVEQFRAPDGTTISTDHPVSKAALLHLTEVWPRAVPFNELLSLSRSRVNASAERMAQDALDLQANLVKAYTYSMQLAELHTFMPAMVTGVSDRPVASPVARFEAKDSTIVTNQWHERAHLTATGHWLLTLLDGTRDIPALIDTLTQMAVSGAIQVMQQDQRVTDAAPLRELFTEQVEPTLRLLAHAGTLVG